MFPSLSTPLQLYLLSSRISTSSQTSTSGAKGESNHGDNIRNKVKLVQEFLSDNLSYVPSSPDLIVLFNNINDFDIPNCMASTGTSGYNTTEQLQEEQLQVAKLLLEHPVHTTTVRFDEPLAMSVKIHQDKFVNSIGNIFHGTTPLVAAVNAENESVVKLLLQNGAIPQQARTSSRDYSTLVSYVGGTRYHHNNDNDGSPSSLPPSRKAMSPLMHSSRRGHVGITKLLLDAIMDADEDADYENGSKSSFCPISDVYDEQAKNALMHACSEGHYDVCRLLIDYAIRWRIQKYMSASADRSHHERQRRRVASKIVNSYKVDTALWYACGHGHADVARLLLERGALPEYRADGTIYSSTPLMEASEWGHIDVVRLLLKQDGTDPRSATGRKAVRLAQEPGYKSVVHEMHLWTRRLNGLEDLLVAKSKSSDYDNIASNNDGQECDDDNQESLTPGLLPFIIEKTEQRYTMTFQVVRAYSEMITSQRKRCKSDT